MQTPTNMSPGVKKYRDFYAMKPDAPIYMTEFGFYSMEKWKAEGKLPADSGWGEWATMFGWDEGARHGLNCLGWCEPGYEPAFETKVVKDLGDCELEQDFAGRIVKFFKGRRSGFMPECVDHPVKDMKTWEENCLWRMNPATPSRIAQQARVIESATVSAAQGKLVVANLVGGYMYLRSLVGPEDLLYMVYDQPELIHACMKTWFELADAFYAQVQTQGKLNIDEVFLAEDICYNHGLLISPDMVREFLFPYYQQLLANIRSRQPDKSAPVMLQVDTDGFCDVALPLYREIGLNFMSPFEAASNCDVVRTAREYPDLLISGGFDKRIIAAGKDAIDREIDRILPVMKKRGGYYPTCDHGVPEEVKFEDYVHFRKRLLEFA